MVAHLVLELLDDGVQAQHVRHLHLDVGGVHNVGRQQLHRQQHPAGRGISNNSRADREQVGGGEGRAGRPPVTQEDT